MVSALDVYLVMQLDAIVSLFAIMGGIVTGFSTIILIVRLAGHDGLLDESKSSLEKWIKRGFAAGAALLLAATLTPASKTAAAMILVPALTSEQVVAPVTAEAKELYALAKSALRDLATKDKTETKEKQ